jgi:hypothetical protein
VAEPALAAAIGKAASIVYAPETDAPPPPDPAPPAPASESPTLTSALSHVRGPTHTPQPPLPQAGEGEQKLPLPLTRGGPKGGAPCWVREGRGEGVAERGLPARLGPFLLVFVLALLVAVAVRRPPTAALPTIVPVDAIAARSTLTQSTPWFANGAPQFGMNTHLLWGGPARAGVDIERIAAAGQTVVRFDVDWDSVEPTAKGDWDTSYLTRLDQTLDLVEQRGLHPILVVVGTPAWARSGLGTRFTPPDRAEDFADAVGYLAARYADRPAIAYEIWNEPNQIDFWDTEAGPDPVLYAQMLKASYTRIKAAAPNAIVLGGSIAFNDRDYLDAMYTDGGVAGSFDALALHPYSLGHGPEQVTDPVHSFSLAVASMSTVMTIHGEPKKPIWLTEMGWSTRLVGEAVRADYYRRAVSLIQQWPQVAVACVYQLRQDQDLPEFGMISDAGVPTDSWAAYVQAVAAPEARGQARGSIDTPAENDTVHGTITLSGWTIDEAAADTVGVDRVRVFLSGTELGDAELGQQRADIASAYGARFAASGYRYTLDLSRAAPGQHTIEVRAHSTVSGVEMAYVRAITVTP